MTQIEFDMSVRAMKAEAHQEISAIEKLLTETKQEIANINLAMQPFCERIKVLKQKRNILSASLSEKRTEWGGKVREFCNEFYGKATSNLAESSTTNIIYELRRRGYEGIVKRDNADGSVNEFDLAKTDWKPVEEKEQELNEQQNEG